MKNDRQLQQEVVAAIDDDKNVPAGSIGVEVHHGVVKLAGQTTDTATTSADHAARRVPGVTNVLLDVAAGKC